jgi:hypothetical protein
MYVTAVQAIDSATEEMVWHEIQRHMRMKREQFRHIRNFVYLDTCRRRYLMDYFGEKSQLQLQRQTECCSACHPKPVVARAMLKATPQRSKLKPHSVATANVDPVILQRLKDWRRKQAEARDVPAYVIFGDNDLTGIAAATPHNLDELAACRGVGPAKLRLYGDEVLSLLARAGADQGQIANAAAALFESGRTVLQATEESSCEEAVVWRFFLRWITHTTSDAWKQQVRCLLAADTYVAIRAELRRRLHEPFTEVSLELQSRFSHQEISLTRAIMDRVGEK